MDSQDSVSFYINKRRAKQSLAFSVFLTIGFMFMSFDSPVVPWLIPLVIFTAVYFLVSSIFQAQQLLSSSKPIIEINAQGIYERTTIAGLTKIMWHDIEDVSMLKRGGAWANIGLIDSQQFIRKQPSFIAKLVMRYLKSNRFWGNTAKTPLKLRLDNLSVDSQDIFDEIETSFERYSSSK